MSSPWRTGPKIGGLDALPEIVELAKEMLTVEQLERADEMAMTLLTRRKQRRQVQWELIRMIPLKPSRPLMYLNPIIMQLPNATRDVIRYLGDYVDLITKEMTYEFLNGKARFSSLGINARSWRKQHPSHETLWTSCKDTTVFSTHQESTTLAFLLKDVNMDSPARRQC